MTSSTPVVTPGLIQSWSPCEDFPPERVRELMPRGGLTLPEVAELPIHALDRVWILVRCMAAGAEVGFAARVARDALPVWEARFPGDARPRRAVEAAEACARDPTPANARDAAACSAAAFDAVASAYAVTREAARDAVHAAAESTAFAVAAAHNASASLAHAAYAAACAADAHLEAAWASHTSAEAAARAAIDARAERLERYVAWALEAATARPHPSTLTR